MIPRLLACFAAVAVALSNAPTAAHSSHSRDEVSIGVFGLFHPYELVVSVHGPEAMVLTAGDRRVILQRSSSVTMAHIARDGDGVVVSVGADVFKTKNVAVTGRSKEAVDFELAVPRRIQRHYHGTLRVHSNVSTLVPVVAMDLEVAVASIVAAESSPGTPIEALKAQAVAVRSYLVASGRRHEQFDFCDTTHCQFLREPPSPNSAATTAAEATHGLVLAYNSQPFAAMYTRSCSGQTHTPSELGLRDGSYPYFAVECPHCRSHPDRWSSRIPAGDGRELTSGNERARLEVERRLGWQAVPSNDFTMKKSGNSVLLEGTGRGHGIGLCQSGSRAIARSGHDFRAILLQYYPNTMLQHL